MYWTFDRPIEILNIIVYETSLTLYDFYDDTLQCSFFNHAYAQSCFPVPSFVDDWTRLYSNSNGHRFRNFGVWWKCCSPNIFSGIGSFSNPSCVLSYGFCHIFVGLNNSLSSFKEVNRTNVTTGFWPQSTCWIFTAFFQNLSQKHLYFLVFPVLFTVFANILSKSVMFKIIVF